MLKPREINKKNYLEYSVMLNLFYVNCNRNIVCQYQPRFIIFENLVSMQKGGGGLNPLLGLSDIIFEAHRFSWWRRWGSKQPRNFVWPQCCATSYTKTNCLQVTNWTYLILQYIQMDWIQVPATKWSSPTYLDINIRWPLLLTTTANLLRGCLPVNVQWFWGVCESSCVLFWNNTNPSNWGYHWLFQGFINSIIARLKLIIALISWIDAHINWTYERWLMV